MNINVVSTIDKSNEPSLFYPAKKTNRPLLIVLHTWSFDRFNQEKLFKPYATKLDWNLLLPEFRGPNLKTNPRCNEACGSKLARQDIVDAINYISNNYSIDTNNIFLFGNSGGGHMALLMANYIPNLFTYIIANCSVTDLVKWRNENLNYKVHIESCLNGPPNKNNIDEYIYRSPIHQIDNMKKAHIKIMHGKYDESVPVNHSIELYNILHNKYSKSDISLEITDMGHEFDCVNILNTFVSITKEKTTLGKSSFISITK